MRLAMQFLILDLGIGDFVGEILGLDRQGRQKIRQRATAGDAEAGLHVLRCLAAEQGRIAFAEDAREVLAIHATFLHHAGQLALRQRQFFPHWCKRSSHC